MNQNCVRRRWKFYLAPLLLGWMTGIATAQNPKPPAAPKAPEVKASPAAGKPTATPERPSEPPNKVVLKVGNQEFTKADMDMLIQGLPPQAQHAYATQGKRALGDQYSLVVALSQQAHLYHLDESPEFVRKLALQKQEMEAQLAFEEISKQANVTPEEIQKYYDSHSSEFDEISVRQFVIRKKAPEPKANPGQPTPPSGPGLNPEEANTRAEAIRKELTAGTDIKKVVDDFKAPGDVIIEAEPRTIRRGGMRPEMEKVAFALKDGEVSEPIDLPQALVFFQVTKHSHSNLQDVAPEIEKSLRQQKIDAALAGVKKETPIWMDDQYFAAPLKLSDEFTTGEPVVKTPPRR